MKLEDSCCINCGQRDQCGSYLEGDYSDECRFYFSEEKINGLKNCVDYAMTLYKKIQAMFKEGE